MIKARNRPPRWRKPSKKAWIQTVDKRYAHRYGISALIKVSSWSVLATMMTFLGILYACGSLK